MQIVRYFIRHCASRERVGKPQTHGQNPHPSHPYNQQSKNTQTPYPSTPYAHPPTLNLELSPLQRNLRNHRNHRTFSRGFSEIGDIRTDRAWWENASTTPYIQTSPRLRAIELVRRHLHRVARVARAPPQKSLECVKTQMGSST